MEFQQNNRGRGVQPQTNDTAPGQVAMPTQITQPLGKKSTSGGNKRLLGIVISLVVVLVVLIVSFFMFWQNKESSLVDKDKYQAVFLTNGQVYFGKIDKMNDDFVRITDIFYLQVQQDVQPEGESKAADASESQLVKLGGELHAPEDYMQINRDQMLFWENIEDSGKVAEAIKSYKPKE